LGNGRHWTSWIHIVDLVRLILTCLRDANYSGPVNAATPFPIRNSEFTKALAQAVGRPAMLPVPRLGLRLMYGELADAMLASIRMNPAKAIANGFEFRFPRIHEALGDLVGPVGNEPIPNVPSG
jgi:NAD dependent epimerase/dehydratase family enzyme